MFSKVLVANRGAVAARVLRSLAELKIPSVAVYSDADAGAPYLALASETIRIGEALPRLSYLNQDAIIKAAQNLRCDALHPGYGFLSENAEFAQSLTNNGVTFIGPSAKHIAAMGNKARARALAVQYGLPIAPGSAPLGKDPAEIYAAAANIGFPVMVKPAGGGGGIGMLPVRDQSQLLPAIEKARSMAQRGFGNPEVYLEKLLENPRHVEIQVMGDRHGNVCHLFDRDCSTQRRNQKIVEESPAPGISAENANSIAAGVAASLKKMGYDNIGTVEMLMSPDGVFTFLEMNTRLQVEHGVTEEVCSVDLVAAQILSASGRKISDIFPRPVTRTGHAIEARVCAEDPVSFFPSPGPLQEFDLPNHKSIRVETGYRAGQIVSPYYDSLLAKIIVHRPTRAGAIADLIMALESCNIQGVKTNIPTLLRILRSAQFASGGVHTGLLKALA